MELRKSINTAGVLNWTPAPRRTSPPSSAMSEDGWDDEGGDDDDCGGDDDCGEEEELEELRAEDFERHMDKDGIIGLREALEDVALGEKGDEDGDDDDEGGGAWVIPAEDCGGPEEPLPGATAAHSEEHGEDAAVGKPSRRNGRSEKCQSPENIPPFSLSPRRHPVSPPPPSLPSPSPPRSFTYPHLLHFSSEELAHSVGIEAETLPDRDGFTESLSESCCSSTSRRVSQASKPYWLLDVTVRDLDSHHVLKSCPDPASVEREARHKRTKHTSEKSQTNQPERPRPSPRKIQECSPRTSSSRTSNLPERSSRTAWIMKDQSVPPEHQPARNASPSRKISRTSRNTLQKFAKDEPEVRRVPPSFRTPDFSKVEPRVHFPKSGYEPPKSSSSSRVRLSPEPTLIFKSPADIAKEILFSSTDAPPSPPPSPSGPEHNITISIVPGVFRCPQQATRLVEQLQEDYNTLLMRFAEAENTIDRMRLEAKVNLYSDPKRPDQSLQSTVIREGSKVMTQSFPQAQRAVMGSHSEHQDRQEETQPGASPARPCAGSSSSSGGRCGSTQSPTRTLTTQANKFLQQVKTFEDLIKSRELEPFERLKGLSRLVQGLDLLERGYLAARDERSQLQCQAAEVGSFDPNRELEGLIFQCGTCVEELRELSEQEQFSCLAPPSPAPRPSSVSLMSEPTEPLSHPQSPVVLLPGERGSTVGVEVSSPSGESGGEMGEEEEEEHLFLRPFRLDEPDFNALMDSYQSFQELPTPARVQTRGPQHSPRGLRQLRPQDQDQDQWGTRPPTEAQSGLSQRQSTSDDDDGTTPTNLRAGQSDRPALKSADQSQDRSLPGGARRPSSQQQQQQPTGQPGLQPRGWTVGRYPSTSLTSLGESGEWETKSSRPAKGSRRVMSQDGIVSPETDSGFVGSEGTLAAVTSPLHQRGPESMSLPQTRILRRQQAVQVNLPLPPTTTTISASTSSPPPPTHQERSSSSGVARLANNGISARPMRSSRPERRRDSTAGASHRLVGGGPRAGAASGTSDPGLDSELSHCVSEYEDEDEDNGENDKFGSPSFRSHRHSDHPHNAPSTGGQVTDHNVSEAMEELQVEVSRLKERLESSLRARRPAHPPPPASPPSQPQPTRPFPARPQPSTSTPHISSGRSRVDGERGGGGGRRQGRTVTEGAADGGGGGAQPTWRRRKRASSAPTQRPQERGAADPEWGRSASRPPPSRAVPVPPALRPDGPRTRTPDPQPQSDPWSGSSVPSDEPPASRQHSARQHGRSAFSGPGNEAPVERPVCAMCGLSEPAGPMDPHTVHRRDPERVPRGPQPEVGLVAGLGGPGLTAPAPSLLGGLGLLHWLPACHPALLLCSCSLARSESRPPCVHTRSRGRTTSEVRGCGEVSRYAGPPLVAKQQDSLSCSLNKAIRAARDMKLTSRRMARSLASGLHYQETLSQSCIY